MFQGCSGVVPGCSGLFRVCSGDVPGCSGGVPGVFRGVPGFTDTPFKRFLSRTLNKWTGGPRTEYKMGTEFKSTSAKLALGL